jgi:outer membrane protein assembly factor BamB
MDFSMLQSPTLALLILISASPLMADDWNQWMGPTRDGVYRESGIVDSVPESGLNVKWRVPIKGGYAGPAVVDGKVYVMDYLRTAGEMVEAPNQRPKLQGRERVICFDASTGQELWKHEYECDYEISYPAGPRATPTVVEGLVVTLGAEGDLRVLTADDGVLVWSHHLPKMFGVDTPIWGFSAHPLVTKSLVITMVGGEDQAVVAFDRATGKVVWKSLSSSNAGYCPPSIISAGGVEQLLVWHPEAVASLNPADGKPYWITTHKPDYGMSICRPMREGAFLFVSGIENKSMMLKLSDDQPSVTELWASEQKTSLSASTSTPLIHDGVIYGSDEGLGAVLAIDAKDGRRLWQTWQPVRPGNERPLSAGTAFITRHEPSGQYLLFGETGLFSIAAMSAERFQLKGQMQVLDPTQTAYGRKVIWSHPAYANQTAYFRNDKELVAVSLVK